MGKIVGIAGVGLAQFIIWSVLIIGLYTLLPCCSDRKWYRPQPPQQAASNANNAAAVEMINKMNFVRDSVNWSLVLS